MGDRHAQGLTAFLVLFLVLTIFSTIVEAQETQPGDVCTLAQDGYYRRSSMTTATDGGNMMICDGSNWIGFLAYRDIGNVGLGTSTPDASALLEISSTDQGFLPPRMSDPNLSITAPATGLIAYNNTTSRYQYYDGASWQDIGAGATPTIPADSIDWDDMVDAMTLDATTTIDMDTNAANLNFDNNTFVIDSVNNYVGIGLAAPTKPLDIRTNAAGSNLMRLQNESATGWGTVDYHNDAGAWKMGIGVGNTGQAGIFQDRAFISFIDSVSFIQGGSELMRVNHAGGGNANIGIGNFVSDTMDSTFHLQYGEIRIDGGAANEAGCIRFDDTTDQLEYSHDCITYAAIGGANAINDLSDGVTDYVTDFNMFMGDNAGAAIAVGGQYNTAVGQNSLAANTVGDFNVAYGYNTLSTNVAGTENVAIGYDAMRYANDSAVELDLNNTAVGVRALMGSTTPSANVGRYNTAVGNEAMRDNTSGDFTTALGQGALRANTTGLRNVAVGAGSMFNFDAGNYNTAIGTWSMLNSTGGDRNVAVGYRTFQANTTGTHNTAVGGYSLLNNLDGIHNTGLGYGSLQNVTSGSNNIAIGYQVGDTITTGSNNIIIGYSIDASSATASNELNIGDLIYGDMAVGNVGIGTATPASELQVVGDIQTSNFVKYDGVAGNAPVYAVPSMALDDLTDTSVAAPTTNHVLTYNGTNWVGQASSGLWTDNTTHVTRENFHVLDAGLAAGSTTAVLDGDGIYSFYDPDKGAFRGGEIAGGNDAWQDANVATNSFAWGWNNEASGVGNAVAMGGNNTASGPTSFAFGWNNTSESNNTMALGASNEAQGFNSIAMGVSVRTGNGTAVVFDDRNDPGLGNYSAAFGLGQATGAKPQLSGNQSFAIFFGDQSGEDISATNVLALEGGSLLLSNDSGTACDAAKDGALRLNATSDGLEMCDDGTTTWVSFGAGAINDLSDGATDYVTDFNMFMGDNAGTNTPVGAQYNIAIGQNAFDDVGKTNLADFNTMIGYNAGSAITDGHENTGVGSRVMQSLTTGQDNVAVGHDALESLTTGNQNVAIGQRSMENHTTGRQNVAIGPRALSSNLTNDANIAIGYTALQSSNGGANNVAIGDEVMQQLLTGVNNVAIGLDALKMNQTGSQNTVLGTLAGAGVITASDVSGNVLVGYRAGHGSLTGADNNVFLGHQAGDATTTGSDNIIIGYDVDASAATASNEMNIGGTIFADMANGYVGIGVADATVANVELDVIGDIEYTGTLTDMSDRRLKSDIKDLTIGQLDKITALKPVSFKMKSDEDAKIENGFIAQDVQKLYPELVYERTGGMLSMNYTGLIAPMVKALKEQQNLIEKLEARIEALESTPVVTEE